MASLSLHNPYTASDEVYIGDGISFPIANTGSTSLPSSSRSLLLNNILHVPNISRNLLSVSKLCHTNNVTIEFNSNYFSVKDRTTGVTLLTGPCKNGIYEWPSTRTSFQPPIIRFSIAATSKAI